jgi:hypothetical protein
MPEIHNCTDRIYISAEYLNRHKVSVQMLNKFQVMMQGQYSEYGITWSQMAEISERVATHWNTKDGQLNNFNHFALACRKRAFDLVLNKKDNEQIVKTVQRSTSSSASTLLDEPRHTVTRNANVYENYEPAERQDYYPNAFNIGHDDEPNGAA